MFRHTFVHTLQIGRKYKLGVLAEVITRKAAKNDLDDLRLACRAWTYLVLMVAWLVLMGLDAFGLASK
jgi:hypothetical protein